MAGLAAARSLAGSGLLLLTLLAGCTSEPDSPEARIRALLDRAEQAVEARSLSASMALISPAYRDAQGRDLQNLQRLLMGYFLRHKTIYVLQQVSEIQWLEDGSARVVLFAGVAGNPPEGARNLGDWRGDLIRLELRLVVEDGEWRLVSADWRRASQGELG